MLKIEKARFVVRDVHPNLKVEEDEVSQVCACALTISTEGKAREILAALQLGPLADALYDAKGRPRLEWADITTRYRVTNVTLHLAAKDLLSERRLTLTGCTLGKMKVVPTGAYGLNLLTTVDSPISSDELAALFDLRMASEVVGSVEQRTGSAALPQV